jgi:hypothetical protein
MVESPENPARQRLTDNAVVIVAAVLAIHSNMPQTVPTLQFVGVMGYGFNPPAVERFKIEVRRQRTIGKFLRIEQRQQFTIVHPSDFLLALIGRERLPADAVADIRTLPTAPDDRDVAFKQNRK